jgi:class 3 adenylate cyclase
MRDSVKQYAEEARHAHGVRIQIRVGLNSGEVVVRAIGSDLYMDYGRWANHSPRRADRAHGQAWLGADHRLDTALAEGFVEVHSLGDVPVKGLEAPTPVYETQIVRCP